MRLYLAISPSDVQELALVLVNPLDLHVEERGGIDFDSEVTLDRRRQTLLVPLLDGGEFLAEASVVGQREQLLRASPGGSASPRRSAR